MKYLFILNDPPYGTERSYNALRHARELLKEGTPGVEVKIFLVGDAAAGAKAGQKVPQGYYSVEALLHGVSARGAEIGVCGSCMEARGLGDADLAKGCVRSTMAQLAAWSAWADKLVAY